MGFGASSSGKKKQKERSRLGSAEFMQRCIWLTDRCRPACCLLEGGVGQVEMSSCATNVARLAQDGETTVADAYSGPHFYWLFRPDEPAGIPFIEAKNRGSFYSCHWLATSSSLYFYPVYYFDIGDEFKGF